MKLICTTFAGLLLFCLLSSASNLYPDPQSANDSIFFIEKVYLHTDRDDYFPGDDIWLKAYLVDAADRFLTDHSMNLHVELISPEGKIIDSRIVRLDKGLGHGDFHLSANLPSGKYRLRAYTNYMRNYTVQDFFKKDFSIINSTDALKTFSDSISYKVTRPDITFFPEGGSLVDSVPSIVAFKAVDQHNRSLDVSGEIVTAAGDSITGFKSTHKGMGTFMLQPLPGVDYYALIQNPLGDTLKYKLSKTFSAGIVMNVAGNFDKQLKIIFRTNALTLPLLKDHELTIMISARGNPFKEYTFRMNSLNSQFLMPTDDLPNGIVMLTLRGSGDLPLCERLLYINNGDVASLKIETDRSEYNCRDSVKVKLALFIDSKVPQDADLSFAATNGLFMNEPDQYSSNIASWFLLESDIKGKVEEPAFYFDPSNKNRLKDLDILLLTQGWRDFRWKYSGMEYPPEYGFTISGKARKKLSDSPVRNAVINIGLFDKNKRFINNIPTDSDGSFSLNDIDVTGKVRLVASITGDKDKFRGWLIMDSVKYNYPLLDLPLLQDNYIRKSVSLNATSGSSYKQETQGKKIRKFVQQSDYIHSVQKRYKLSDTIKPGEVMITARKVDTLGSPRDRSLKALGTMFPDREVVLSDIDRKVYSDALKLIKAKFIIYPPYWPDVPRHIKFPIYMVDGVEVDKTFVEALPASYIERIDASSRPLYRRFIMVDSALVPCDGTVSIILRQDYFYSNNTTMYSVNTIIKGFDAPRIFYSPKHHTTLESDYKPDLRNTLFWDPDITLKENKDTTIVFYNSDNPGSIIIKAEGITDKGIPVTGITVYRAGR
ncbi:MAG TPA: MG2 domain-containing protein [Bacteroidales bacterium]|nr:MG2 domain-containing protein [Bacteroidales bacterium]